MIPGKSADLDAAFSFVEGDWFPGVPLVRFNPAPDAALATVRLSIKSTDKAEAIEEVFELSSDSGGITVLDVDTWEFSIPPVECDLTAGLFDWQLMFTDEDGVIVTYGLGQLTVFPDVP